MRSRAEFYESLLVNREKFISETIVAGEKLKIPDELKGRLGTSGAASTLPGAIPDDVLDSITRVSRDFTSPRKLADEIRSIVKSVYGDEYDVLATNSCESALRITYGSILSPPSLGQGDSYNARCIGLLERHTEHHLSYGAPFPPVYKDLFSDRGNTAGEFGIAGRRIRNLDVIIIPMAGANYQVHGPKMITSNLLLETDASKTFEHIAAQAKRHETHLTGFVSLGYDTIGYGYGEHCGNGAPVLQASIGQLAQSLGLPYVVDNAWGVPFVGADPRLIQADVMLYSMDKLTGAPISGLVIGRENPMVSLRHAAGVHSERFGTTSSHGKAAYSFSDPGKLTLAALVHVLRKLRDSPEHFTSIVDEIYEHVMEEFTSGRWDLSNDLTITKSYNLGGVEINYEKSWKNSRFGIPIFTYEDRIANTQMIAEAMSKMGVNLVQAEDGNIILTPGLGTTDSKGKLIAKNMRYVIKTLFIALSTSKDWALKWA